MATLSQTRPPVNPDRDADLILTHDEPPTPPRTPTARDIGRLLAAPFSAEEVKWKPAVVSGNRALAIAYISARAVMDRLDEVLGAGDWQDQYEVLPCSSVVCRLRLWIGSDWVTKEDVGSPSEQPDEGDRVKAAFSDALKRAAVKFGIGRYLYRLPSQWVDYDPQRKQFTRTPSLPSWALPAAPANNGNGVARGTITRQQLAHLGSLCDKVGYAKADLGRDYPGLVSRTQLSKEQASELIGHLLMREGQRTTADDKDA